MVAHKSIVTPVLVKICIVAIALFYIITSAEILLITFIPKNTVSMWFSLTSAASSSYILSNAQKQERFVSPLFIDVLQKIHSHHPEVLTQIHSYSKKTGRTHDEERMLRSIAAADPMNAENISALYAYYFLRRDIPELRKYVLLWGADGLSESWTPKFYSIGLTLIRDGHPEEAVIFWKWAALLSPSWSHVWIEYASLIERVYGEEPAGRALDRCVQDAYASLHCTEALRIFREQESLPDPGVFDWIINPEG